MSFDKLRSVKLSDWTSFDLFVWKEIWPGFFPRNISISNTSCLIVRATGLVSFDRSVNTSCWTHFDDFTDYICLHGNPFVNSLWSLVQFVEQIVQSDRFYEQHSVFPREWGTQFLIKGHPHLWEKFWIQPQTSKFHKDMELAAFDLKMTEKGSILGGGGASIEDLSPFTITKILAVYELAVYWSVDRSWIPTVLQR